MNPESVSIIRDYADYELSRREQLQFEAAGYFFIACIVFLFYHSLPLALLSGLLIRRGLPLYRKALAEKRLQKLHLQFRDLLTSLSASVTAGRQMEAALIEAHDGLSSIYGPEAPIMRELAHMKRAIRENHESDHRLLADFAGRSGSEDIKSFVQVYLTCRSTGGDLERIISHAAEIITDKMKITEEIRALNAQKQLEGRMISLMPAAMLLALNLISPAYIRILYTCASGRLIMTLALAGCIFGVWLMERISHVEV